MKKGKEIEVVAWLKNNTDWYFPTNKSNILNYDNVELLSKGFDADLFYAWNNGAKEHGRLFRGFWNDGIWNGVQY